MTVPAFLFGRRAALSVAALIVGLGATLGVGILGLALKEIAGSRQDDLEQLAQLEARAAEVPSLKIALATQELQARSLASLLPGETEATAQATLQREIKSLVEQNGGEVRSALVLPIERTRGLSRIAVQYELSLPVTKLRDLAFATESHVPYFFISDASLSAPQSWPSDAKASTPRMDVRWTVGAYRWSATP